MNLGVVLGGVPADDHGGRHRLVEEVRGAHAQAAVEALLALEQRVGAERPRRLPREALRHRARRAGPVQACRLAA